MIESMYQVAFHNLHTTEIRSGVSGKDKYWFATCRRCGWISNQYYSITPCDVVADQHMQISAQQQSVWQR